MFLDFSISLKHRVQICALGKNILFAISYIMLLVKCISLENVYEIYSVSDSRCTKLF